MSRGPIEEASNEYLLRLRLDAHLLLVWGYNDSLGNLKSAQDEYEITGLLVDAMERRINDPGTPDRFVYYSVHNERPIGTTRQLGKKRPRLDIQIERAGIRPKQKYTMEAKRMRDDDRVTASRSIGHYIGNEGIGRFVANFYEPDAFEAVMLGCMQAHDAEFWLDKLKRKFAEDVSSGLNELRIVDPFKPCSIVPEIPSEASSTHQRLSGNTIRLLHVFLCCF